MKKKEKILYIVLIALFVGYVVVEQYAPEELSWVPSYSQRDKSPYGAYVLYDRLGDFFEEKQLAFETLYELTDSSGHIISLSTSFQPSEQDYEALMKMLSSGRDVLIGANYFSKKFMDTLGIASVIDIEAIGKVSSDSIKVTIGKQSVYFPRSIVSGSFQVSDTSGWNVLGKHTDPILIQKNIGKGSLLLTTAPLTFTNYGVLRADCYLFAERTLQQMANGRVIYNRYYHSGRGESTSPFRYLISQNPLRWAVYLTLFGVLLLLIIGSQRKQRAIPILDPMANTTLKFIKTMGGLYHREGNHRSAAEKLVNHFLKSLSEKYYISQLFTERSYQMLAVKSGLKKEKVIQMFDLIQHVKNGGQVSGSMLNELNEKIAEFKLK